MKKDFSKTLAGHFHYIAHCSAATRDEALEAASDFMLHVLKHWKDEQTKLTKNKTKKHRP